MEQRRRGAGGKKEEKLCQWERMQLGRLFFVFLLFLAVFIGKRAYPVKMLAAGERIMDVLSHNMDIEAVFSRLGSSITGADEMMKGLETFCVEVFGELKQEEAAVVKEAAILAPVLPAVHSGLLENQLEHTRLCVTEKSVISEEEEIPAVGTVVIAMPAPETPLPEGYTADKLSFGSLETVAPVVGHLNSGYGYRIHPIKGTRCFHGGADISARAGDPIGAFADGVVEYTGEDDSYGLYLQLDHGNGIKSFYAHCQSLCVRKGESVSAGECVATVGATGTATGPHLHLELKCAGLRVDPAYYVELL